MMPMMRSNILRTVATLGTFAAITAGHFFIRLAQVPQRMAKSALKSSPARTFHGGAFERGGFGERFFA
jgi:hypothetical protein